MTDPSKNDPATAETRRKRQKIQRQLDEALEDSFPASDPVSIVTSHEEEDWGDGESPAAPEKPPGTPQGGR
ncbi:MAG: hypothetical protein JO184_08060 [Gammaproteobacteria bacterium]|nr:hypothetical protein [Gammaproteobacteria bacterium]